MFVRDVEEDCLDLGIARPGMLVADDVGPFVMNSFDSYVHIAYGWH